MTCNGMARGPDGRKLVSAYSEKFVAINTGCFAIENSLAVNTGCFAIEIENYVTVNTSCFAIDIETSMWKLNGAKSDQIRIKLTKVL